MVISQINAHESIIKNKNKKRFIIKRVINEKSIDQFSEFLSTLNLECLNDTLDPNERWLIFRNLISNLVDQVAPKKKFSMYKSKPAPWFDNDLVKHKRIVLTLSEKVKVNKANHTVVKAYKESLSKYKSLIRIKKNFLLLN